MIAKEERDLTHYGRCCFQLIIHVPIKENEVRGLLLMSELPHSKQALDFIKLKVKQKESKRGAKQYFENFQTGLPTGWNLEPASSMLERYLLCPFEVKLVLLTAFLKYVEDTRGKRGMS